MKNSLILLSLFCSLTAFGQTGDLVKQFIATDPLIQGDTIDVYFHVPMTYDAGNPSKLMVGLHGLGNPNNSTQIRDFLSELGDSMNAIIMCPDPYLQQIPESKVVVNESIDSVLTWYNIDTSEIYIIGYSAGSDVAAQYALESPNHTMKGLIWYAPGFFASPNMANESEFPPVCLCWGDVDNTSFIQAGLLNDIFAASTVPYLYNEIPGVAHTMDTPLLTGELLECVDFIDAQYNTVGIQDMVFNGVRVFPNPVLSDAVLRIALGNQLYSEIEITDLLGRKAFQQDLMDSVLSELEIVPGTLSKGVYLLTLEKVNGTRSSLRFVVR